jgi:hypothetical protein
VLKNPSKPSLVADLPAVLDRMSFARRLVSEAVGTAILLATVVGSGIMGERLSGGNVAVALLANTLATGSMLVALILAFGPISGAHFNPAVTLADACQRGIAWRHVPAYIGVQFIGQSLVSPRPILCSANRSSQHPDTFVRDPPKCSASS